MIELTQKSADWITQSMNNRPNTFGIRFGVRTTGCSGLAYVVEFVDTPDEDSDVVTESNGIRIVVDKKSVPYLFGLVVDFAVEGLNSGLKFINPNESAQCGCGESFTV